METTGTGTGRHSDDNTCLGAMLPDIYLVTGIPRLVQNDQANAIWGFRGIGMALQGIAHPVPDRFFSFWFYELVCHWNTCCCTGREQQAASLTQMWRTERDINGIKILESLASTKLHTLPAPFTGIYNKKRTWSTRPTQREKTIQGHKISVQCFPSWL